jgi:benzaldehyde dehydrogenase (NAD)
MLARAVALAARLEAGGGHHGLFCEPAVLSEVGRDNPAFIEQIFGPVAVVITFGDDEDASALANDSEFGLSMAVISSDAGRALGLGERLRSGLLHLNDQTGNDTAITSFAGVGASGNGTSIGGPADWQEFS